MKISLTVVNCNGKFLVKFGNGDEYEFEDQEEFFEQLDAELFLNGITDVHSKPRTDPWTQNCEEHP